MDRHTSLFLDICRFSAALMVFLAHMAQVAFPGSVLAPFQGYAQTAVIVFFVLSGYVIAYVHDTREKQAAVFVTARLARLYSVIIPALVLTAVLDIAGMQMNAALYHDGPLYFGNYQPLRYLASSVFASYVWRTNILPGTNAPFWSMSYEVAYYILFAAFVFLAGWRRWLCLALVTTVGGPSILSLLPVWLAGAGLYRLGKAGWKLPSGLGPCLMFLGLLILLAAPWARHLALGHSLPVLRPTLLADYWDTAGFLLLAFGFIKAPGTWKDWLLPGEKPIRYVASMTFSLYLFHVPVIFFCTALGFGTPGSAANMGLAIAATALVVLTLGRWCEKQKAPLQRALLALAPLVTRRKPAL